MTRRTLLPALALLAAALPAANKPNFSGEWKLDAAKSDLGPMPVPDKFVRTIEHKEPSLSVSTVQSVNGNERTTKATYTTDGKESTNDVRGMPVKSVMLWDGDALSLKYALSFGGADISIQERWTLSPDGKTCTVTSAISTPQGDVSARLVLDRQ